jgi:glycosyltransferase involved in cell wall biosynthesis
MKPPHRRMRILMTTDAVGGVWVQATTLARALCRRNYEVVLVTLGPAPRSDQLDALQDVPGLRLEMTDLELEWMDPEGADFARAMTQLKAVSRRVEPDLVHVNGYREAQADWSAPVVVGAHSCVGSWWRACRPGEQPDERWLPYTAKVREGLALTDDWVSPTAAFRDEIQRLYNPPTRGRVIWNGLPLSSAKAKKEPFILAAGRMWDEAKNIPALAAAAPGLPWPVRVAGPLRSSGAEVQSIPGVELLGELPRDDLLTQMQRAAIFVSPALYEPFGLTVLEAAASGCALVLSDIPTFHELWDDAAVFVDPRKPADLHAALDALARDDGRRATLQRRAAARAKRYALQTMADEYSSLYETLTGSVPLGHALFQSRAVEALP